MRTVVTTRIRGRVGLGTAISQIIHAAPMPRRMRQRLRNCPGCKKRVARLDLAVPNINPFSTT